jgi:3-dehydroquinate synthase
MKVGQFIDLMAKDKKNVDGKIKLILLKSIGKASLPINVDQALLEKTLKNYAG